MISVAWAIFRASPIARWLAKIGGLVLLVLTFGAYQRRQGAQGQKAKQATKDAKAYRDTTERIQDADAAMGDDPAVLRDSLRQRDPNKR